jgi:hypothetical protein
MRKHGAAKMVEVLFFEGCPNHEKAADAVRDVAREVGVAVDVTEVEVRDAEEASRLGFLGSPTVRVDGLDVEPEARRSTAYGLACRTYGTSGVPPRDLLVRALGGTLRDPGGTRSAATGMLGAGALLLPVGTCPACYPAYAAALSSVGLGFLLYERYLLPLTVLALGISLAGLASNARTRRGYGPLLLGLAASAAALFGRFAVSSDPLLYGGLAALVAASVWNAWPLRLAQSRSCPRCALGGELSHDPAHREAVP